MNIFEFTHRLTDFDVKDLLKQNHCITLKTATNLPPRLQQKWQTHAQTLHDTLTNIFAKLSDTVIKAYYTKHNSEHEIETKIIKK